MGLRTRRSRRAARWRPGAAASRRASVAVSVVLVAASGVAIFGSRAISAETESARAAVQASDRYEDAKFWGAREDAALNEYLITGDASAREMYDQAAAQLTASLRAIESVADAPAIRQLLDEQGTYTAQAAILFNLVDGGKTDQVPDIMRLQTEPILEHMTDEIGALEAQHHASAAAQL